MLYFLPHKHKFYEDFRFSYLFIKSFVRSIFLRYSICKRKVWRVHLSGLWTWTISKGPAARENTPSCRPSTRPFARAAPRQRKPLRALITTSVTPEAVMTSAVSIPLFIRGRQIAAKTTAGQPQETTIQRSSERHIWIGLSNQGTEEGDQKGQEPEVERRRMKVKVLWVTRVLLLVCVLQSE